MTTKREELLHLFDIVAHESDTPESIHKEAESRAKHEYKQQCVSLTEWDETWRLYLAEQDGDTYHFEVYGTYKYVSLPDYVL